ncbi:MAG: glutamate synthase subunit beta [Bacteroidota bacterium]
MADPKGFLKYERELPRSKSPQERVNDYREFYIPHSEEKTKQQASRCMDCGVPFCHHGCPLGNLIPDFNDAVYQENWAKAYEILSETNNFPEFTGRICPAPCEGSCVLGINKPPVAIEHIEKSIAEKAFQLGLVKPQIPSSRTGKTVAVIGSGPAGLATAVQLNAAGHSVTVFERAKRPGGLLRYGIPDFKLEKSTVERRIKVMEASGIQFKCGVEIGKDIPAEQIKATFDAMVLTGGATIARDLPIAGRELKGVHLAMDFLTQQNQVVAKEWEAKEARILATDKNVVVIGGGDTGADCVGTSNRHKASSITQLELLGQPPTSRAAHNPWPEWPMTLRTSSSHEEGCERNWSILTEAFIGDENQNLRALQVCDIAWDEQNRKFEKVAGSSREIPCELALLAIGFVSPDPKGLLAQLAVALDDRGNVATTQYQTSVEGIFAAGDMRRGQSLVVWAISEGREAAIAVDQWLKGESRLPAKDTSHLELVR